MSGSAATLSVTIAAKDQASGAIARLSASTLKLQAGFGRLSDRMGSLNSLGRLGDNARSVARGMEAIVPPLAALTAAGTVAGVMRLASSWAGFGAQLGRDAYRVQTSVENLNALQGAARLAGSSAEAMTQGMQGLGDAITDAVGGRNQTALMYFKQFGIDIGDLTRGAKSASEVLPQVFDAIARVRSPALQARLMNAFSLPANLLPFARRGAAGLREYTREARFFGIVSDEGADKAAAFERAQNRLSMAGEGLSSTIGRKLHPILTPLLDDLATWIGRNRELIGQNVGQLVGRGFEWVKEKVVDAYDSFNAWVGDGGWEEMKGSIAALAENIGDVGRQVQEGLPGLREWAGTVKDLVDGYKEWNSSFLEFQHSKIGRILFPGLQPDYQKASADAAAAGPAGHVWTSGDATGEALHRMRLLMEGLSITRVKPDAGSGYITGADARRANDLPARGRAAGQLETAIEEKIRAAAAKYGVPEDFAVNIARTEGGRSGGRDLISPAGAIGTMQLMPGTAAELGVDPNNVDQNIDGGVRYLKQLLRRFRDNQAAAAAGYNAGPNSRAVANFAATGDASGLPRETQGYVATMDRLRGQRGYSPDTAATLDRLRQAPPQAQPQGQQTSQRTPVDVTIKLAGNVPAGTTITTRTPDGVKVERAMQGGFG